MNKSEVVNKIKELLKFEKEVEAKFIDVVTTEGVILSQENEDFVIGETIMIKGVEGAVVATEGDYLLEDGRTIMVDAEGVLAEIKEAKAEETEVEAEVEVEMAEDGVVTVSDENKEIDVITDEVVAEIAEVEDQNSPDVKMEGRIKDLEDLIRELVTKQGKLVEANVAMASIIEDYGNETTKEDLNIIKTEFSVKDNKSDRDSALDAISKFRRK